jgi:hypothetical protein
MGFAYIGLGYTGRMGSVLSFRVHGYGVKELAFGVGWVVRE